MCSLLITHSLQCMANTNQCLQAEVLYTLFCDHFEVHFEVLKFHEFSEAHWTTGLMLFTVFMFIFWVTRSINSNIHPCHPCRSGGSKSSLGDFALDHKEARIIKEWGLMNQRPLTCLHQIISYSLSKSRPNSPVNHALLSGKGKANVLATC